MNKKNKRSEMTEATAKLEMFRLNENEKKQQN